MGHLVEIGERPWQFLGSALEFQGEDVALDIDEGNGGAGWDFYGADGMAVQYGWKSDGLLEYDLDGPGRGIVAEIGGTKGLGEVPLNVAAGDWASRNT